MPPYVLSDVIASYRWLGHGGFTELNAYHRDYRPGREHAEWNAKHGLFPIISYAKTEQEVVRFVRRNHEYRMLCYGLNPRPRIFLSDNRRARSAREAEIGVSQNLVLDIDIAGKQPSEGGISELADFLNRSDEYFLDQGLKAPVKAFTGRGYHLLCPFPGILVSQCPDIALRLKHFAKQFGTAYRHELAALDARLDFTQDLRRMVKIYGTAKPRVGIISEFYGSERREDERLHAYILGLEPQQSAKLERDIVLHPAAEIPRWFEPLLAHDARTRELWAGCGKVAGTDTSRSGYDYSLVLRLLRLGYTNLDELASILALRPEGAVQKSAKGQAYLRRTIENALGQLPACGTDEPADSIGNPAGV